MVCKLPQKMVEQQFLSFCYSDSSFYMEAVGVLYMEGKLIVVVYLKWRVCAKILNKLNKILPHRSV